MHESQDGFWRMLRDKSNGHRAQSQAESMILSSGTISWAMSTERYACESGRSSLHLIRHKGKLEKAGMSKHSYKWSANIRHSKSVRQDRDVTPQQRRLQLPVSIRKREIKIKIIHT